MDPVLQDGVSFESDRTSANRTENVFCNPLYMSKYTYSSQIQMSLHPIIYVECVICIWGVIQWRVCSCNWYRSCSISCDRHSWIQITAKIWLIIACLKACFL